MGKLKYPLQQVLDIKARRVSQAEKVAEEKKRLLEKERQKLKEAETARQKVAQHRDDKLQQLREGLDEGKSGDKLEQMRRYLKEVKEKLKDEDRKVERQKKQVEGAEKQLEEAKAVLKQKRLEFDKLEMHKKEWVIGELKSLERAENKKQDEIGSLVHLSNRRKESEQKKRRQDG